MRLSHTIEYYSLISFARILCIIPKRWALGIGSATGAFGWALGIRKELVLANIANARPDADQAELKRIGKQAAKNFGRTAAEFLRFGIKDRNQIQKLVQIDGLATLESALQAGKGAIILTGHFGAWAVYFAAISMAGIPLSLLVGKQHNEKVDKFIHKIPGDSVEFISKGRSAIKTILEKLKLGRAVVMVSDQHSGKSGVVVPFLGKNASTLPLPGSIAAKYQIPVFTMTGHRLPDGNHRITIKPLQTPDNCSQDELKVEILKRYNEELGHVVSALPEQYFWYHRRWREESKTPVS